MLNSLLSGCVSGRKVRKDGIFSTQEQTKVCGNGHRLVQNNSSESTSIFLTVPMSIVQASVQSMVTTHVLILLYSLERYIYNNANTFTWTLNHGLSLVAAYVQSQWANKRIAIYAKISCVYLTDFDDRMQDSALAILISQLFSYWHFFQNVVGLTTIEQVQVVCE